MPQQAGQSDPGTRTGGAAAGNESANGQRTGAEQRLPGASRGDHGDGRDETENERMDRNWNELLQELRVTQTGTQILSGFLLAIAFQPTFSRLDSFERTVYLTLVIAAAATTALGLAPVNLHRGLFRKGSKKLLVQTAHVLVRCALVGVAIVLTGTVLLIFNVVVGREAALIGAGSTLLLVVFIAVLPAVLLRRRQRRDSRQELDAAGGITSRP
ncbi:MAG TPA: DUF6328 family protein [Propionibacteriaceae bacterium]|nr:DUF6328 family protein [Propionibacteriaceae bacterium]